MRDDRQLALFHRSLAELCRSEVPLGRAFRVIEEDVGRGRLRAAARGLAEDVERGAPLAEAYRKRAADFPPLYAALVEAGVSSGDLPGALEEVARHAAFRADVRARVRQALFYPLVTAAFVVGIGAVLLFRLGPAEHLGRLDELAVLFGGDPRALERSRLVLMAGLGIAGALAASLFVWRVLLRPAVGRHADHASLATTMAACLRRGLPLGPALDLASGAADDPELRGRVEEMARAAREGLGLSASLERTGVYPPSLIWLVTSAEGGGGGIVAAALDDIARIYREKLEAATERLTTLVGPTAEIILGLMVLGMALRVWPTLAPFARLPFVSEIPPG